MANNLAMEPGEIARNYRHAADKHRQIGILAQLNAVSRSTIVDVLRSQGELQSPSGKRYFSLDDDEAELLLGVLERTWLKCDDLIKQSAGEKRDRFVKIRAVLDSLILKIGGNNNGRA